MAHRVNVVLLRFACTFALVTIAFFGPVTHAWHIALRPCPHVDWGRSPCLPVLHRGRHDVRRALPGQDRTGLLWRWVCWC